MIKSNRIYHKCTRCRACHDLGSRAIAIERILPDRQPAQSPGNPPLPGPNPCHDSRLPAAIWYQIIPCLIDQPMASYSTISKPSSMQQAEKAMACSLEKLFEDVVNVPANKKSHISSYLALIQQSVVLTSL